MNLSGLKIQPKRWKKNIGDYYTPELAEGESYDTYPGYTDYVIDANGNHLLEWNTISSNTGKEVRPVLSGTGISSDEDKARRFIGGNVYGGCYNSGHINGNVIINMNSTVVDRKGQYAVFDQVLEDEGEAKLYENENYHIMTRVSGVILDEQGMDVLGSALNVFGGGYGKGSEIWGNVTVNLNAGYTFQIFGGGEQGVIGKPNDGTGDDYTFNSKTFKYNPKYSCTINVKGNYPGVARNAPGDNDNMASLLSLFMVAALRVLSVATLSSTWVTDVCSILLQVHVMQTSSDILPLIWDVTPMMTQTSASHTFVTTSMVVTTSVEESWALQTSAGA